MMFSLKYFLLTCEELAGGWKQSSLDHLIIRLLVFSLVGRIQYYRENKDINSYVQGMTCEWLRRYWTPEEEKKYFTPTSESLNRGLHFAENPECKMFSNAKPHFKIFFKCVTSIFNLLLLQLLSKEILNKWNYFHSGIARLHFTVCPLEELVICQKISTNCQWLTATVGQMSLGEQQHWTQRKGFFIY